MNLLMITSDRALAAGKQGAFYNTLAELHKHFDRINVICPRAKDTSYEVSVFGNVFIHPSPWPLMFQWFWIYKIGRSIIAKYQPAVMSVQEYAPVFYGVGAYLLHRATKIPYELEVMHVPGLPRATGTWERLLKWLLGVGIARDARAAQSVRVINEHETPDFLVAHGVPKDKIAHVPAFYIDLETFTPVQSEKQYDAIFVGRLASNKGLDVFLEVVRKANIVALVVGEGPLVSWAKRKARSQKLKINFHGYAKDSAEIASLINRSRLLLMTSLNEGGPRVVLEALACGVPVVATPVGIVPDVLPPECIEDWNTTDMGAKVRNLLDDTALYERVREAGLFTVQRFERKAAIAVYAEYLKKVAQA